MKTFPSVTVIIPVYNVEEYLEESVYSVIGQEYPNIRIILVDDGSTDRSGVICDDLKLENNTIHVIHQKNKGLSGARNAGILNDSESDYVLFLDSDDVLVEGVLPKLVEKAESDSADIVIPDRYNVFSKCKKKSKIKYHFQEKDYTDNPKEFAVNVLIDKGKAWRVHSLLIKSDIIRNYELTFIEGIISEDFFFMIDALTYAAKISIFNASTVYYRVREGSITSKFHPDYENTLWMIDQKARYFLTRIGDNPNRSCILTKRNLVAYLFSIYSPTNMMCLEEKRKMYYQILSEVKVREYFSAKTSLPYFNNKGVVLFFYIQYWLIRRNLYATSKNLCIIGNVLKRMRLV